MYKYKDLYIIDFSDVEYYSKNDEFADRIKIELVGEDGKITVVE